MPAIYISDTTDTPIVQATTDTSRPEHYLEDTVQDPFVVDPGELDTTD